MENLESTVIGKIDNKEELSEREIIRLINEYTISEQKGEEFRWAVSIKSIVKLMGRYFCIEWQRGLTEYQDDSFNEQPYEVEKVEYEKTIKVIDWRRITNGG